MGEAQSARVAAMLHLYFPFIFVYKRGRRNEGPPTCSDGGVAQKGWEGGEGNAAGGAGERTPG